MKMRIEPTALAEAEDAGAWYEAAREGLGEEFLDEFDRASARSPIFLTRGILLGRVQGATAWTGFHTE
jgi:hypothetical protein